jgi:hypothetical protein
MVRFFQVVVASTLVVFGASFGWLQPNDGPIGTAAAQGGTAPGTDAKPNEQPKTTTKKKKATQKKSAAKKKATAEKKAAPKGPEPKGPGPDTGTQENR